MKFKFNKERWNEKNSGHIETIADLIGWTLILPFVFTIGLPFVLIEYLDCFTRTDKGT